VAEASNPDHGRALLYAEEFAEDYPTTMDESNLAWAYLQWANDPVRASAPRLLEALEGLFREADICAAEQDIDIDGLPGTPVQVYFLSRQIKDARAAIAAARGEA